MDTSNTGIDGSKILQPGGLELTLGVESRVSISAKDSLLSIGCGLGEIECYLAGKYRCAIRGIDNDPDCIEAARARAKELKLTTAQFDAVDASTTCGAPGEFDWVFCCGGLTNVRNADRRILAECRRVLKSTGKMIVIQSCWARDDVTPDAAAAWHRAQFLHPLEVEEFYRTSGFEVVTKEIYCREEFWENWCNNMAHLRDRPDQDFALWIRMREQCRKTRDYLGVGLFILR